MDANESKTQTPNLVEKVTKLEKQVTKLEKQNILLLRRLDQFEKAFKSLETSHRMLSSLVSQVNSQKHR